MGEARRRREIDPNFGTIRKSETRRGIVINPCYRSVGQNGFTVDTTVLPSLLRQCLLYWDRIEWPDNNLVSIGGGPDVDYLVSTGVLQRTKIVFQGAFGGDLTPVFSDGQLRVFEHLERKEPGVWSLAQANDSLAFDGMDVPTMRSLDVQFYDALPAVPEIIPFADILEFRSRYVSELLALRTYMDGLYEALIDSPDVTRSRTVAMDKISKAIIDLEKALTASRLPSFRSNFSVCIKISDVATQAVLGAAMANQFGAPISLGAGLGAMVGMLQIQMVSAPMPLDVKNGPFAYLYKARKELR